MKSALHFCMPSTSRESRGATPPTQTLLSKAIQAIAYPSHSSLRSSLPIQTRFMEKFLLPTLWVWGNRIPTRPVQTFLQRGTSPPPPWRVAALLVFKELKDDSWHQQAGVTGLANLALVHVQAPSYLAKAEIFGFRVHPF